MSKTKKGINWSEHEDNIQL